MIQSHRPLATPTLVSALSIFGSYKHLSLQQCRSSCRFHFLQPLLRTADVSAPPSLKLRPRYAPLTSFLSLHQRLTTTRAWLNVLSSSAPLKATGALAFFFPRRHRLQRRGNNEPCEVLRAASGPTGVAAGAAEPPGRRRLTSIMKRLRRRFRHQRVSGDWRSRSEDGKFGLDSERSVRCDGPPGAAPLLTCDVDVVLLLKETLADGKLDLHVGGRHSR